MSDADKSNVDPDGESLIPNFTIPLRTSSIDLHAHHHWHSSKPRSTHLATQPRAAQREGEVDICGLHPPSIRPLLSSPMATRHHSTFFSARLCSARRPHNHELYDLLSASTMSIPTASTSISTMIIPARYMNDCAHRHVKKTALAPAYAAPPQASLYYGQYGRRHTTGICVCRPPGGDARWE